MTKSPPVQFGPWSERVKGELSITSLFEARMKREGRLPEYEATLAEVRATTGKTGKASMWEAMRRCGYTTPRNERKLYREWEANMNKTVEEVELERLKREKAIKQQAELAEIDEESRQMEFEQAVRTLPDTAPLQAEWDWIGAHPAMMRMDRSTQKLKLILLDAGDVLKAPHGAAPSKRAVGQLQHWCNTPREFWKALIAVGKKQQPEEETGGKSVEPDEDLASIEQMLAEVTGGKSKKLSGPVSGVGRLDAAAERPDGVRDSSSPGREGGHIEADGAGLRPGQTVRQVGDAGVNAGDLVAKLT